MLVLLTVLVKIGSASERSEMIDAQSLAVRTTVLAAVALITFYLRRAVGTPAVALPPTFGRLAGRTEALDRLRHRSAQPKAKWRKSTFSGLNGCVEIAFIDGQIAVRDSKDRNGAILLFTRAEWDAFLIGIKKGQFD
jgi:Domain of unknown function (DUF397)